MGFWRYINFYLFKRRGYYVIRKFWDDERTQIGGIYTTVSEAIDDCISGYSVYNAKKQIVYSTKGYVVKKSENAQVNYGYYTNYIEALINCPLDCKVFKIKGPDKMMVFDPERVEDIMVDLLYKQEQDRDATEDISDTVFDDIFSDII